MRKAIRQIAVCAGLLLAFCLVCRFAFFRDYTAYIPIDPGPDGAFSGESMVPEVDQPEVVRIGPVPLQAEQVTGEVPGFAPVPLQVSHSSER